MDGILPITIEGGGLPPFLTTVLFDVVFKTTKSFNHHPFKSVLAKTLRVIISLKNTRTCTCTCMAPLVQMIKTVFIVYRKCYHKHMYMQETCRMCMPLHEC